jgi:hypothetical protein
MRRGEDGSYTRVGRVQKNPVKEVAADDRQAFNGYGANLRDGKEMERAELLYAIRLGDGYIRASELSINPCGASFPALLENNGQPF